MSHRANQEANWALWEQYNPRTGNWLSDSKDILLRFFQDFFYQMPSGEQPSVFHFEPLGTSTGDGDDYKTSEQTTEIIITDAGSVNTETLEKRPCLIISRGPFAYNNMSMDNLLSIRGSDSMKTHTDLLSGSFTIHCIAREGLEAERLAVIVARALRVFRDLLQKAGFFHVGTIINIGSETSPGSLIAGDSEEDFIDVPISFPVYYQDSWTVTPESTVLNKIVLTAYAIFRDFDGDLLSPVTFDEDGNPTDDSDAVLVASWTVSG